MEELEVNREAHDESVKNGSPTKRAFSGRKQGCEVQAPGIVVDLKSSEREP